MLRRHPGWLAAITAAGCLGLIPATAGAHPHNGARPLHRIKHLVVLYEENHSFDNLYGTFPGANGLAQAPASHTKQVDQNGQLLKCLAQDDPHLTSPPLPADACSIAAGDGLDSHFTNDPFSIDQYIPPDQPTRDLVHRYYQNQLQIDGGKNDKFAEVSDALGLTMGHYDTQSLPMYRYARKYTVADDFFMGAFGGSFLNHQWLIAAKTPTFPDAPTDGGPCDIHSVLDPSTGKPVKDAALTTAADGDFAVNTIQPVNPPFNATSVPCQRLPAQTSPTIGDRLSDAGVSWDWYSGGWNDAVAGHPDPLFQYHHQPFAYYAKYAPGTPGRQHLKDESEFFGAAAQGHLPAVSFVKPIGKENEHPGYGDLDSGEQHAVAVIQALKRSPEWKSTAVVVTYDENGGFWDHVSPPQADRWGPGTRVPTLVISHWAKHHHVDHTQYDTTSILATIERRWGLPPLTTRDATANDLRNAFRHSAK
jgi:acid phosphatase